MDNSSQVAKVLESYLAQLEAGERPDREALFARYPELALQLSDCLDALELVHHVAPQLGRSAGSEAASVSARHATAIGDFQIIREIGRGGMGVVYEAIQLSLGRRVALKVLPFATMLDKRQLARFKNEAKAAAREKQQ